MINASPVSIHSVARISQSAEDLPVMAVAMGLQYAGRMQINQIRNHEGQSMDRNAQLQTIKDELARKFSTSVTASMVDAGIVVSGTGRRRAVGAYDKVLAVVQNVSDEDTLWKRFEDAGLSWPC